MALLIIRNDSISMNPKLTALMIPLYISGIAITSGSHTIVPIPLIC